MSNTPKKESECHQTAAANQKHPAPAKQPTFTHLANFQFISSSAIPIMGRITSTTNSNHNWKMNLPLRNPTLRSLININQATQAFAAKTQAKRIVLFAARARNAERPPSISDKGFLSFVSIGLSAHQLGDDLFIDCLTRIATWPERFRAWQLLVNAPTVN
jgi:hypothetical protein